MIGVPVVDAEHAHVGDRDRAAAQVGRRRLAGPRRLGQVADRLREAGQRQRVRVLDRRHDQAAVGGRRDTQVHVVPDDDLLGGLVPRRVDHRLPVDRDEQRLGHEQQRRHPDALEVRELLEPGRRGHRLGDVDLQELGHVRCRERARRHRGRHVLTHAADRDPLLARERGIRIADRWVAGRWHRHQAHPIARPLECHPW